MSSCCSMATDAPEPCLIVLHSHSQAAGFQGSDANGRRCSEQCNTNAHRGWTGSEGNSLIVWFQHTAFLFTLNNEHTLGAAHSQALIIQSLFSTTT